MPGIVEYIDAKLTSIKAMPFEDIAALPSVTESSVLLPKGVYSITVWKDRLRDASIRVVVQGYRAWVLGIGSMWAYGFVVASNGAVRDLSSEELWEFS